MYEVGSSRQARSGMAWDMSFSHGSDFGRNSKVDVQYKTSTIQTNHKAPVHATLLLDISSSMEGARLKTVIDAVKKLIKTCFKRTDFLTIWTFNNECYKLVSFKRVKDINMWRLANDLEEHCGNLTCLYDCMDQAHTELCQHAQGHCHRFFIVFTDGEDTASTRKPTQVRDALRNTSVSLLRTIFITAGLDSDSDVFQAVPPGGKVFRAEADARSISEQFVRTGEYILGELKVTVTDKHTGKKEDITYRVEASTRRELAEKMDRGSHDIMAHFRRLTM